MIAILLELDNSETEALAKLLYGKERERGMC